MTCIGLPVSEKNTLTAISPEIGGCFLLQHSRLVLTNHSHTHIRVSGDAHEDSELTCPCAGNGAGQLGLCEVSTSWRRSYLAVSTNAQKIIIVPTLPCECVHACIRDVS